MRVSNRLSYLSKLIGLNALLALSHIDFSLVTHVTIDFEYLSISKYSL